MLQSPVERRRTARERRRARRAPVTAAVAHREAARCLLSQATDIGPQGMCLRYVAEEHQQLPSGEVTLEFELPGVVAPIRVRAEVVFDRSDGRYRTAGVRFANVADADAAAIDQFLQLLQRP